jgi:hypothetical protein
VNHRQEPQNIVESLSESFDRFDDEEPMCSAARELFRNEIVPRATETSGYLAGLIRATPSSRPSQFCLQVLKAFGNARRESGPPPLPIFVQIRSLQEPPVGYTTGRTV